MRVLFRCPFDHLDPASAQKHAYKIDTMTLDEAIDPILKPLAS
jgi:hypothetical protein